ncbi:MAG: hypothetical protein WA667_12330 [Candidatus Nitrosopolaris sp.]
MTEQVLDSRQLVQFAIKLKDEDLNKFLANKPGVILTNVRGFQIHPKRQ